MENVAKIMGTFLAALMTLALVAVILAWPVQLLWNGCLVPAVNGVNEIGFFQALGLIFLFGTLFKNSNTKKND
jgi:hypothetical protein